MKSSIYDLTLADLEKWVAAQGAPAYRSRQIFQELYRRGVADFNEMTALPKEFRQKLQENFSLITVVPIEQQRSADGTVKWLSKLSDDERIETVLIPATGRNTVCVSTQVGCAYGCAFCASGQLGFFRNLSSGEILQEVLVVQRLLMADRGMIFDGNPQHERAGVEQSETSECEDLVPRTMLGSEGRAGEDRPEDPRVSNIVFMGMGEPLANYDNLMKAIRILNHPEAFKIGARKITISTVGLVPMIERLSKEGLQIELSVSLHAPNDELRKKLMPVNVKYPLDQLIPACRAYTQATRRIITFEYILMDHVNDSLNEAKQLIKLLQGLPCKINLLPCHPTPGRDWQRPSQNRMMEFERTLRDAGLTATLRRSRGLDIDGACGQLRLRRAGSTIDGPQSTAV